MSKEEIIEKEQSEEEQKKETNGKDHKKSTKKNKADKYQEQIKKLKTENENLHEQLLRKIAEFENYKKRTEREYAYLIRNASENLIFSLLPILDDLDRSLAHSKENTDEKTLRDGMELIAKKLLSTLEKEGLSIMETIGQEFDPEKHDALLQVEKKGAESGTIVEEHLKGYMLNDKVIRHSQVVVAK